MKYFTQQIRFHSTIIIILLLGLTLFSCENKIPVITKSDLLTLPASTAKDFTSTYSDSGKIQLILSAPLLEQYDKTDQKYLEFKHGIKVDIYNGHDTPVGKVTAHYAKCTDNNLWELRDSVVVINESNEKLETELLFWNQEKDKIYTDRFVKITSADEIAQGIGFESDSHLYHRKLLKVTAEITMKNEK